jgi:hypothetical protein
MDYDMFYHEEYYPPPNGELSYIIENISSITKEELRNRLEKVGNLGRPDWGSRSPLKSAFETNRQDLVEVMVKRSRIKIDSSFDHNGFPVTRSSPTQTVPLTKASVLSYAALTWEDDTVRALENEDRVRFLVYEMKAKVNININGTTPLIAAICSHSRNLSMVKLLVEELKADVNFRASINRDGSNPYLALHAAIAVE